MLVICIIRLDYKLEVQIRLGYTIQIAPGCLLSLSLVTITLFSNETLQWTDFEPESGTATSEFVLS